MPWSLGAIYWATQDADDSSDTIRTWVKTYPDVAPDLYQEGKIRFIVMGGSLGFSVAIFSSCAIICILTLMLRRRLYGGELGGPPGAQKATAAFFVLLWITYISVSSVKAISDDNCA